MSAAAKEDRVNVLITVKILSQVIFFFSPVEDIRTVVKPSNCRLFMGIDKVSIKKKSQHLKMFYSSCYGEKCHRVLHDLHAGSEPSL